MSRILIVDFLIGRYAGGHIGEYLGFLREAVASMNPEVLAPYLDGPRLNRWARYRRFTSAMWHALRSETVVVFHTPELRDVLVLWLLTALPGMRRGVAVLMMRRGAEAMIGRDDWRARFIERGTKMLVQRGVAHLVSDSRAAADVWEQIVGMPVPVISLPVRPTAAARASQRPRGGPMRIALLGLFRTEKGIDRYEAVMRIARELDPTVMLLCQLTDDPAAGLEQAVVHSVSDAYGDDPGVDLNFGHLSSEAYDEALRADIVVLPYDPKLYTSGTSGLLFDAVAAGAIAVVTKIPWGVAEFSDSSSVVWLEGRSDDDLREGLDMALQRAQLRRLHGLPPGLPSAEAFRTGWLEALRQAAKE